MSYILDALKRAEAERDPDARMAFAAEERSRRRVHLALYGVAVALLANAVVLLWLFLPDARSTSNSAEPAAETTIPAPPEREGNLTHRPVEAVAPEPTNTQSGPQAETPLPAASPSPPPAPMERTPPASPLRLGDLPDDARHRFPELTFTTHIFANEPDLRAVVVNGQRLTEGSTLGGLLLEEITEDGAVFRFESYRVAIDVVSAWD